MNGLDGAAQIAIGQFHTCVLITNGTVRCWGEGSIGQLGDGVLARRETPVDVKGMSHAVQIAASLDMTCALIDDGTVDCWGGGIRNGSRVDVRSATPIRVEGLSGVSQIKARGITCALKADGTVSCWDLFDWMPRRVEQLAGVQQIGTGNEHACAVLADATVRCWGSNFSGQLGIKTDSGLVAPPATLPSLDSVVEVTGAYWHTCAQRNDGSLVCWGGDGNGQCGDGTQSGIVSPTPVQLAP
jgi:alpha-tubulin suppressor-like RCC1 family protein